MATLYSNELKAVVVMENFLENPKNVLKEKCLVCECCRTLTWAWSIKI